MIRNGIYHSIAPSKIAFLGFAVIVPISYLYNWYGSVGIVPWIPYYALAQLVTGFCCVILLLNELCCSDSRSGYIDVFFFLLLVAIVLAILTRIFVGHRVLLQHQLISQALSDSRSVILDYSLFYVLGKNLTDLRYDRRIVLFLWILMVVTNIVYLDPARFLMTQSAFRVERVAIYITQGDRFALWSLLTLALVHGVGARLVVILLSAFSLFAISSRASLFALLCSVVILAIIDRRLVLPIVIALIALGAGAIFFLSNMSGRIMQHRIVQLVLAAESDQSALVRAQAFNDGLRDIRRHLLTGNYLGHIGDGWQGGGYIHSYLSIWSQFGLCAFLAMFACLGSLWHVVFQSLSSLFYRNVPFDHPDLCRRTFLILGTVFSTVLVLFARNYASSYIWLFAGMAASMRFKSATVRVPRP